MLNKEHYYFHDIEYTFNFVSGVYIMHVITWKVGGGGGNEKFDEGKKKLISAEQSEAEILMEDIFYWGRKRIISVENI